MIGLDLVELSAAIFARLATDPAGEDVRELLGSSSPPAIVHAEKVRNGIPSSGTPALPFLALRGEAAAGATLDMRTPTWRWYVYDDPRHVYRRINAIVREIGLAYRPPESSIPGGRTEVSGIGPETFDDDLGLVARSVQITHYRRG